MNTPVFRVLLLALLGHSAAAGGQPTAPPDPASRVSPIGAEATKPAPSTVQFELHGFAGGSLYAQDVSLGPSNGGGSWYVVGEPKHDKWSLGGDVRQTRLNLSVAGRPVMRGATPKAVVEIDLFGGNGAGAFGDVSVMPRLRLAYAELKWQTTTFQFGQAASLVLAITPTSVGHVAYPLTYAAGTIGWRYPGLFVAHTIALAAPKTALEISGMLARPAWQNPSNAPFAETAVGSGDGRPFVSQDSFGLGLGEASGIPQLEGRVKLTSPHVDAFVAGHAHRVDRSGTGTTTGEQIDLDVVAANAGFRLTWSPLTLQGSAYLGKNLAPLVGTLVQFQGPTKGDIHEWGVWGQAGYALDPRFSVWALAATSRPKQSELRGAGLSRLSNAVVSGMMRYQEAGYSLGLELTRWYTRKLTGAVIDTMIGDQVMMSGTYAF